MSDARLQTCGDLRDFLAEVIVGVRNGSVDPLKADRISKLAGQISASMVAEAQVGLATVKAGQTSQPIGQMLLGDTKKPAQQTIEHNPTSQVAKPAPTPLVRQNERIFCDQCDRNVTVGEAVACKSTFCKAKAAA